MPYVALVGVSSAGGGQVLGPGTVTTHIEGMPVACVGDAIAPHGIGAHANAVITQGSTTVTIDGRIPSYVGALCSCGHVLVGGSLTTQIGI